MQNNQLSDDIREIFDDNSNINCEEVDVADMEEFVYEAQN